MISIILWQGIEPETHKLQKHASFSAQKSCQVSKYICHFWKAFLNKNSHNFLEHICV